MRARATSRSGVKTNTRARTKTRTKAVDKKRLETLLNEPERATGAIVPVPRKTSSVSEAERAVRVLKAYGYNAKVFCLAEPEDAKAGFTVKSKSFNWVVSPITGTESVPERFIEGARLLLANGVSIDAIAIAKPEPVEPLPHVIKHELLRELRTLKNMLMTFVSFLFKVLAETAVVLATINETVRETVDIPDPVLLVRVQNSWIEVGRWG